jgi:hypothetical protein
MSNKIYVWVYEGRFERIQEDYLINEDETIIIYQGYMYKWEGRYYRRGGTTKNPHSCLHRAIYETSFGEIPAGHHIHHKDGDSRNNTPSNLECIERSKHLSIHMQDEKRKETARKHIVKAMEYAKKWHGSEEGSAWHKEHGKNVWDKRAGKKIHKRCLVCEKEYEAYWEHSKYCSNGCKSKARVLSRKDNEDRKCVLCESEFNINKYSRTKTCSKGCAIELAKRTRLRHRSGA